MASESSPGQPEGDSRETGILLRYLATAVLARLTDEAARVGLVLLALERTGSAAYGGILVAALMLPHVVAAPLVGAAANTVRRRRLCYAAALLVYGSALVSATIMIAAAPAAAIGLIILAGCVAPLLIGGLSSLLRELTPRRLDTAFGIDSTSYSLAGIAGPALAAVSAGAVGAATTMLVLGGVVAVSCVMLLTLPIADRPASRAVPSWQDTVGAIPLMWRRPALGAVTLGSSLGQIGIGALPIAALLLAVHLHHTSYTGIALSAVSVGGLAGSLLYLRHPLRRLQPEWVVLASLLAITVPFALVPLMPSMWATLPLLVTAGLINGPLFCSLLTVREREAPAHLHTQVFTIGAGLKSTSAAVGAAAAGLCTGLGATPLILGIAACQALGSLVGVAVLRTRDRRCRQRLAGVEDQHPMAIGSGRGGVPAARSSPRR